MPDKNALPSVAPGGWIVLGLLVQEAPQSGYDLASRATRGIAHFWPITKAQVYAELPRLEAAGLANSELVTQVGVPDKRLYRPTTAGNEAFKRWLATESFGEAKLRHPLLMQLWFAEQGVASTFATQCQQHRDALAAQAAHFSGLIDKLDAQRSRKVPDPSAAYRRLALRHGILRIEAELAWLDEVALVMPTQDADGVSGIAGATDTSRP